MTVTAWVEFSYRSDIRAARDRISVGSKITDTPCGVIEYADVGNGPPVLAVHGSGGGFDAGLELARPLIESGFRVVAVSRFGYLRSPFPPDALPPAQADAFACLLDALKLDRVAVIAVSAGAPSAMQLCVRHPDRCSAMTLLSPAAFAPPLGGVARKGPRPLVLFLMKTTLRSDFLFWIVTKMPREFNSGRSSAHLRKTFQELRHRRRPEH